jgi:26S proteasome regulatory subunit T5
MSESSTPLPASHPSNDRKDGEMDTVLDVANQTTSWDDIPADILAASTDEILTRIRLIENDIKVHSLFSPSFLAL